MKYAGSAPLRGRDEPLSRIDEAIGRVAEGQSIVLLVEGAAGHGKSRLLAEVVARARQAGVMVAACAAEPTSGDAPYATLLTTLMAGEPPLLTRDALHMLRGRSPDRYWFELDLGSAIEEVSVERPVLIALDDLQWADALPVRLV